MLLSRHRTSRSIYVRTYAGRVTKIVEFRCAYRPEKSVFHVRLGPVFRPRFRVRLSGVTCAVTLCARLWAQCIRTESDEDMRVCIDCRHCTLDTAPHCTWLWPLLPGLSFRRAAPANVTPATALAHLLQRNRKYSRPSRWVIQSYILYVYLYTFAYCIFNYFIIFYGICIACIASLL